METLSKNDYLPVLRGGYKWRIYLQGGDIILAVQKQKVYSDFGWTNDGDPTVLQRLSMNGRSEREIIDILRKVAERSMYTHPWGDHALETLERVKNSLIYPED